MRFALLTTFALCAAPLFAQSDPAPKFDIADVHVSAKTRNAFPRTSPARGGRYEVKTATMVDLIRIAYAFDPDKILGGPSWLEMDRFDVIAKEPPDTTPETRKLMLQSLLADRFNLKFHKDTKPLPAYALIAGKKPLLKPADGTEEAGCKVDTGSSAPSEGSITLNMSTTTGAMTTIHLAPGGLIHYTCRNMTMAAFAREVRGMIGADLGTNPLVEDTGLKGAYNFDIRFSLSFFGPMVGANAPERITMFDAVEKQLGLKLEQRQVPTPVLVVDSVNRTPSDNPPGLAEALPPIPAPTEFEVADLKPSEPGGRGGRFQTQPGGRLVVQNMPLSFLISRAFDSNNNDEIVGMPKWSSDHYDVTAKAPSTDAGAPSLAQDAMAPMIRALLVDRFKMTYHTEQKPVSAYTLVAVKPKLKKADPASRTYCKNTNAPPNAPPGSQVITCQNVTMAQFADRLQNMAPGLNWPIEDVTEIEGGWDFTLTYSRAAMMFNGPLGGRGGDAGPAAGAPIPTAADPSGGLTIFEAVEKELGLKLESRKRTLPVYVIDHMEPKPTEN
jgi:uncharacterized protein (TIGR03435 family)